MAKTRFFRVAVEGATATDGRKIEKAMIDESAAGYRRETYGARINMEHIRGFTADGAFKAYGDVLELRAQDDDIVINGKTEKRRALYASIEPTADLVAINKDRQKIYTSCEFAPNFGGTGKFGLVGLAVTDSPASLGTEILQFAATNAGAKAMFDGRKLSKDNLFSAAEETKFEVELEAPSSADAGAFAALFAGLKQAFPFAFTPAGAITPAPATTAAEAPPAAAPPPAAGGGFTAEQQLALGSMFTHFGAGLEATLKPSFEKFATVATDLAALRAKLETTEQLSTQRPPASGGAGHQLAEF